MMELEEIGRMSRIEQSTKVPLESLPRMWHGRVEQVVDYAPFEEFGEDNIAGWDGMPQSERDRAFNVYLTCFKADFPNNHWVWRNWEPDPARNLIVDNCASCQRIESVPPGCSSSGKFRVCLPDVSRYGFVRKFEEAGFHIYGEDEIRERCRIVSERGGRSGN